MSLHETHVSPRVQDYLFSLPHAETPGMRRIREACEGEGLPCIGPDTGSALRALAAVRPARRALEIGCLHAYGALWIARGMDPEGALETIEIDAATAAVAEANVRKEGLEARVRVLRGAALLVLPTLSPPYDLIFLDAAKAEYPAYLAEALRLASRGTIIAADNVLWQGRVMDASARDADTEGIRAFTERIFAHPRLVSAIVPVGDGLSVSVVR
ncbi:MAG TPA: O-methyltransferase [Candidatus Thermoplasmatota archaeon]|nr:O-methyltransferase [Candidatus Thermoplasmatota archaeon]